MTCIQVIKLRWHKQISPSGHILILDPWADGWWSTVLQTFMAFFGYTVEEAQFFAGHLRTLEREAIRPATRKATFKMALQAAELVVNQSKLLEQLNRKWGRNTILLYLAQNMWRLMEPVAVRLMVTEALVRAGRETETVLIVGCPNQVNSDLMYDLCPNTQVYFYRDFILKYSRLVCVIWWGGSYLSRVYWSMKQPKFPWSDHLAQTNKKPPALLLLQEDDLSLDRSYRTQPHWLFPAQTSPSFRTFILKKDNVERVRIDETALIKHNIFPVKNSDLATLQVSVSTGDDLQSCLIANIKSCIQGALFDDSSEERISLFVVAQMLRRATLLAAFCQQMNVRVFMTGENYMIEATAMNLIASQLEIKTLSLQYSNLSYSSLMLLSTADVMQTFSPLYHPIWQIKPITPKSFVNSGYIFDSSFQLVRARAKTVRCKLAKAGVQFVICYFDESVMVDKYSTIDVAEYQAELFRLMEWILDDPSLGLIVKVQFQWNSPQNSYKEEIMEAVQSTGRYAELSSGIHRNNVFPAEAAMAADMAIGHLIGGTASLEAALTGVRSLMLNPYGFKSVNSTLYEQCDLIYSSMPAAIEAIDGFRQGLKAYADLGDWSPILHEFDPFQDGQAAQRMYTLLEQSLYSDFSPINETAGKI